MAVMKIRFFLLLVWVGLIVVFSLMPHWHYSGTSKLVSLDSSGYFQHALGYFILGLLAFVAFPKKIWCWLFSFFIMSVFLELAQLFIPERSFNVNDILFNSMGLLLAGLVVYFRTAE